MENEDPEKPFDITKAKNGDIIMHNGKLMKVAKLLSDKELAEILKKHLGIDDGKDT
jgi:hypothetical protein